MKSTVHATAEAVLLTDGERADHARRVRALRARNALLTMLETARLRTGMSKAALAERAGLEASSVRRLLTSKTANPTTDNAFRLMAAMGVSLRATLPSGESFDVLPAEDDVVGASNRG